MKTNRRTNCFCRGCYFGAVLWPTSDYSLISGSNASEKSRQTCIFRRYCIQLLILIFITALLFLIGQRWIQLSYHRTALEVKQSALHETNRQQNLRPENISLENIADNKSCYETTSTSYGDVILFHDILGAIKQPTPDRSIFFIETSCLRNGIATLNARQACAVESAARWNPDRDVFVLFPSQVGFSESLSSPVMKSLHSYQNVHFRRVDFRNFSKGTPVEEFFKTDKIFELKYFIETFSVVLRYLTLYKFGGIYLDLDTVTQKNFNSLPANFAGIQNRIVGSDVLGFDSHGRKIVELIIKNLTENYDPNGWNNIGSQAITQTLQKICNATKAVDIKPGMCADFHVLPKDVFYPIPNTKWEQYFDANVVNETLQRTNSSVVIDVWDEFSSKQPILKDFKNQTLVNLYEKRLNKSAMNLNPLGESAYGAIAKMNCPRAFELFGDLF